MKIILANPSCKLDLGKKYEKYYIRAGSRWPHSGVKKQGTIPHYLPFPFYLACSAALLKKSGFDVHAVDAVALDMPEESFLKYLSDIKPDLLFFEVTTPTINYDLKLINTIKTRIPSIIVAIGGAHATTFADQLIGDTPSIDFILKGEYEIALNDLAISIRDNSCRQDRGVIAKDSKDLSQNGALYNFPFPAYDMFPSNNNPDPTLYWDGFCQMSPAIQIQSSRGCPYRCNFCLWNSVIYGHGPYRTIDPVRVVDQMEYLVKEYKAKEIYFDDDSFTIDRNHVVAVCTELVRRNIDVKWSCMADVAGLDEQLLRIMAQAGCIGIKFGVESGSKKVLQGVGKPVNLEKVGKIVSCCRSLRIKSHATFAIGLLDETEDEMKQTLRCAQNLGADSIQISIATPLPGTRFYEIVKERGGLLGKEWEAYDGKISGMMSSSCLVHAEKLRKRAMIIWLLKTVLIPARVIHHLQIVLRTVRGMGIRKFSSKLASTIIDEWKNA